MPAFVIRCFLVSVVSVSCAGPLALPAGAAASAGEARRIPNGPTARSAGDYWRALLVFNRRTLGEAYQQRGAHDPAWEAKATQFLETCARDFAGDNFMKTADIVAQGKAAIDAGCTDPMVLYCYGLELQDAGRLAEAEVALRLAVAGFTRSAYLRARPAFAAAHLAQVCQVLGGQKAEDVNRFRDLSIKWLAESAGDGSYRRGEQGILLELLVPAWWGIYQGQRKAVFEALQANPKADPYVVKVVAGKYHIDAAWAARGTDWADTVTEEGWQGFDANLRAAYDVLSEAWKLHPELPQAPSELIVVTMGGAGGKDEDVRKWFYRAVAAQMDYEAAYINILTALRGRWGGSVEEMYEIAEQALATNRFDTFAPYEYVEAIEQISLDPDVDGDESYWHKPEVQAAIEKVFAGYAEGKLPYHNAWWWDSAHAAVLYRCGRYAEAAQVLDRAGSSIDAGVFASLAATSLEGARAKIEVEAAGPAPSRGLYDFDVYTDAETECIHSDDRTFKSAHQPARRVADGDQRIVYEFAIPADVPTADCLITVGNTFTIAAAKDVDGEPGEFHEEYNSIASLGRRVYTMENEREYGVNLTPYLEGNPSRVVYVALYDADRRTGWGPAISHVRVVALDDAERARAERRRRMLQQFVQRDRARFLVSFATNGEPAEAPYLYDADGSRPEGAGRVVEGAGSVIYRLPLAEADASAVLSLRVLGKYLASVAPEADGKPGEFREIGRQQEAVTAPLGTALQKSGACYLKIENLDESESSKVLEVAIQRK